MIKFSKEKVLLLHHLIAQETGGSCFVFHTAKMSARVKGGTAALITLDPR